MAVCRRWSEAWSSNTLLMTTWGCPVGTGAAACCCAGGTDDAAPYAGGASVGFSQVVVRVL